MDIASILDTIMLEQLNESMKILTRKRDGVHPIRESVSVSSVAITALIGALIGIGFAAFLGLLISRGVIKIPAFIPVTDPFFTLNAFGLFLAQGAVTGAILGAVPRLAAAREKPAFTSSGITYGGVIVAVNADDNQRKDARAVMEKGGAIDLVNLSEN